VGSGESSMGDSTGLETESEALRALISVELMGDSTGLGKMYQEVLACKCPKSWFEIINFKQHFVRYFRL
jgi:hypothetical protein